MKHDHSAFGTEAGFGISPAFDPRPSVSVDGLLDASVNAYPIVARRTAGKDRLGPAAGAACVLLLGSATLWSMTAHRSAMASHPTALAKDREAKLFAPATPVPPDPQPSVQIAFPPTLALTRAKSVVPTKPAEGADARLTTSDLPVAVTASTSVATATPSDAAAVRRGFAPMLIIDDGNPVEEAATGAAKDGSVNSEVVSAVRMSDPAHTISQGSLISAVLETAIDSDLPGYARAVVTRDVYSFDRSQVLVPRSSRLVGEYKSGLADGQKRVYVTWTRLIRPDGVSIAIASPATSPSGGTGLPGQVNGHFIARFGSAILLTVVGAAGAVGSSGLVIAGSQSAASVAASHDATIPPTIRIRPGQAVRVFTARDLDFSTIPSASSK